MGVYQASIDCWRAFAVSAGEIERTGVAPNTVLVARSERQLCIGDSNRIDIYRFFVLFDGRIESRVVWLASSASRPTETQ